MRKLSLLLALTVASFSAFAQYNSPENAKLAKTSSSERSEKKSQETQNKSADATVVLHSFDFTGGMPANWLVEDDAGIGGWVVQSGDVQAAQYITNPATHTIASTSGGEYLCMPVEFYNTQAGSDPPADNPNLVDGDSRVTTDWMNVTTANGAIALQYEFWGRHYYGAFDIYVYVNNDDVNVAHTFDGLYPNNSEWVANAFPPTGSNPELVIFNISDALPTTTITNVKIAFRFHSSDAYVLSLDDVAIVDILGNDIGISDFYASSISINTLSDTYSDGSAGVYEGYNYGYKEIPANLIGETVLGAKIHQYSAVGSAVSINFTRDSSDAITDWTGVSTTSIATFGPDSILHTDIVGGPMDFVPQYYAPDKDEAWFTTYNFLENGIPYLYTYEAVSTETDLDPSNNTAEFEFSQTWGRYSFHNQTSINDDIVLNEIGTHSLFNLATYTPLQGDMYANTFECYPAVGEDFKIYGVRFFLPSSSHTTFDASGNGVTIKPVLFYFDESIGDYTEFTDVLYENPDGSGDTYTVHENEVDSWVYLPFDNTGGDVDNADFPHTDYRIGFYVDTYNGGLEISVGEDLTSKQGFGHSLLYRANTSEWLRMVNYGGIMIDMYTQENQFNHDLGISDNINKKAQNTVNKVRVYPNPTTGIIKVKHAENATINVYSIAGNLVKTVESNAVSTTIDLSEFAKGTYLVKVVKENEVVTKKVNLLK